MAHISRMKYLLTLLLLTTPWTATAEEDYAKLLGARDGCFSIIDMPTGMPVTEYNKPRCAQRFSSESTFKVAAAAMAFEKGVLKDENQVIKWDGVKRSRTEWNQDQTPITWMKYSAIWVTQWLTPQLGEKSIAHFLEAFEYGNKDFSGGLTHAWLDSSLKISAQEQINFLSKLWQNRLPISQRSSELTKKLIYIQNLSKDAELYGKTGTGCLDGQQCKKMLGWFVGIIKTPTKTYVLAANASDLKEQDTLAGTRLKETMIEIAKKKLAIQ